MSQAGLSQFAADLLQEVLSKAGISNSEASDGFMRLREEAFTETVLELLAEHNECESCDLCQYEGKSVGKASAAKLSAWSLAADGTSLELVLSHFVGSGELTVISKPDLRQQFDLLVGFLRRGLSAFYEKLEESSPAFPVLRQIHEVRAELSKVRLIVLTDALARSLSLEPPDFPGIELEYVAWDVEKLSRLRVGERSTIELDLEELHPGGVPCLRAEVGNREFTTYLAFFPAPVLAQVYGEHGQRLLERNVRAFLQAKSRINKELQRTLKSEPERFLAYNNGLCCTAAAVKVEGSLQRGLRLTRIEDFQIVNGGQTTASLFHAFKKEKVDIETVMVQVKLIAIRDPDDVSEIVPQISRFANSQNKVNGADFAANGKYHRELEAQSRTVWAPAASGMERGTRWYYERARGSYLDDKSRQTTPARQREWALQHPPAQKFTKTDLAKYEHAWQCLPHLVCLGAEKNFEKFAARMEEDGAPSVDRRYLQHVVARALLWKAAEREFDSLPISQYRAQSVAYAVAWIASRSGHRINLDAIWSAQRVPDITRKTLRHACEAAHEHILDTSGNAGEWSKKKDCWEKFRDVRVIVEPNWSQEWSDNSYTSPGQVIDTLASDWEHVRGAFLNDRRAIERLEKIARKQWIWARRTEPICSYARKPWSELTTDTGRRLQNLETLIEIMRFVRDRDALIPQ